MVKFNVAETQYNQVQSKTKPIPRIYIHKQNFLISDRYKIMVF